MGCSGSREKPVGENRPAPAQAAPPTPPPRAQPPAPARQTPTPPEKLLRLQQELLRQDATPPRSPKSPGTPGARTPLRSPQRAKSPNGFLTPRDNRGQRQKNVVIMTPRGETEATAEPHYLLDDAMESGQHFAVVKQKQGHAGAIMLCSDVHTYTVLWTGPHEAGKTHLLYTLINGDAEEPAETEEPREEIMYVTKGLDTSTRVNLSVVDTAGGCDVGKVGAEFGAQGAVLCVALDGSRGHIKEAKRMLEVLVREGPRCFPLLLLGTKADTQAARSIGELKDEMDFDHITRGHPATVGTASIVSAEGHHQAARALFRLADLFCTLHEIEPVRSEPRKKPSKRQLLRQNTPYNLGDELAV